LTIRKEVLYVKKKGKGKVACPLFLALFLGAHAISTDGGDHGSADDLILHGRCKVVEVG
jgi:hypothetical protein